MFYLTDKTEHFKSRRQPFRIAPRDCSKEVRKEPGYIGGFAAKAKLSEHQNIPVK